jgi:hypothetical protein
MPPYQLPERWKYEWEERAAILEYDAGMTRAKAEVEALRLVRIEMQRETKEGF